MAKKQDKMDKLRWRLVVALWFRYLRFYQLFHRNIISLYKERNVPKVFVIGYPKTCLTSTAKALSILGYRTAQFPGGGKDPKKGWAQYLKDSKYDAFTDWPLNKKDFFIELDKVIPNSKYILTMREPERWIKSYKNFFRGAPMEPLNESDMKRRLKEYNDYNNKVEEYFKDRPDQLLIMNVPKGDSWEKLCKFLEKAIPEKPFPHRNKARYKKK